MQEQLSCDHKVDGRASSRGAAKSSPFAARAAPEHPVLHRPGNLGFDPLGYLAKMDEVSGFAMQNKELNNGRLAMIGVAGMAGQELASGAPIF